MHEMSLAEGILKLVEEAAEREGFQRVTTLWLEVGQLSSVEPDALSFCFEAVTQGSLAENAALEIVHIPGQGHCPACHRDTPLATLFDPCRHCGAVPVQVTGGTEMRVKELEVC